jgi:NADH-quinone oxidoreductase subunit G
MGSNTIIQTKSDRVMRVVPFENEAINECWISDKDRFAYEGLNSEDRLQQPLIKQNGEWLETDWQSALEYVASGLSGVKADHTGKSIAAIAHPMSSVEELYLLHKLIKELGSDDVETRLRQMDPINDIPVPWLGRPIAELEKLQKAFIIGSFLRKDHPLIATRLRKATKAGLQVLRMDTGADDWLMPTQSMTLAPSKWLAAIQAVAAEVATAKSMPVPLNMTQSDVQAKLFAQALLSGDQKSIFIGNTALAHPQATQIIAWAQWIADQTGAALGFLGDGANFVGAKLIGATGKGIQPILDGSKKAVVLYQVEPSMDLANPAMAREALLQAQTVIAMSSFISDDLLDLADVILPITPYTEQAGTYINIVGDVQTAQASVRPLGQARPGWKVLRVLGDLLKLDGFQFNAVDEVMNAALGGLDIPGSLSNRTQVSLGQGQTSTTTGIERVADLPIYFSDSIVRRAPSLHLTVDSKNALKAGLSPELFAQFGLKEGDAIKVSQGNYSVVLPATLQKGLASGVVRIATGTPASAELGSSFGELIVERA